MSVLTLAAVDMQTCPQDVPSVPAWCAEVVILARHFTQRGLFDAISTHVQLARGRAGTYELIDFVAVLLGYAASGEVAASPCSPHGPGGTAGAVCLVTPRPWGRWWGKANDKPSAAPRAG